MTNTVYEVNTCYVKDHINHSPIIFFTCACLRDIMLCTIMLYIKTVDKTFDFAPYLNRWGSPPVGCSHAVRPSSPRPAHSPLLSQLGQVLLV